MDDCWQGQSSSAPTLSYLDTVDGGQDADEATRWRAWRVRGPCVAQASERRTAKPARAVGSEVPFLHCLALPLPPNSYLLEMASQEPDPRPFPRPGPPSGPPQPLALLRRPHRGGATCRLRRLRLGAAPQAAIPAAAEVVRGGSSTNNERSTHIAAVRTAVCEAVTLCGGKDALGPEEAWEGSWVGGLVGRLGERIKGRIR